MILAASRNRLVHPSAADPLDRVSPWLLNLESAHVVTAEEPAKPGPDIGQ